MPSSIFLCPSSKSDTKSESEPWQGPSTSIPVGVILDFEVLCEYSCAETAEDKQEEYALVGGINVYDASNTVRAFCPLEWLHELI